MKTSWVIMDKENDTVVGPFVSQESAREWAIEEARKNEWGDVLDRLAETDSPWDGTDYYALEMMEP